nr:MULTISPECIES: peptidoglycan editing factor PgeF [unclassified Ruminococcus]
MKFESSVMNLNAADGAAYLTYKALEKIPFVNHAFSTRLGGVSKGEFESMNLSFGRGDCDENVQENYRRICKSAGFEYESLVASAQDHKTFVRCVTKKDCGVGIYKPRDMHSVDALVTNERGVTLVTYYADCTPLFFVDTKKKVIALAHAGWRGTVGRIGAEVIKTMAEKYGCEPCNVKCAIGPAISKCCYEVDEDCCKHFKDLEGLQRDRFIFPKENGKYMIDLLETNRQILVSAGVLRENITVSDVCTRCNSELLWSHRATAGKRGGMAAFMAITE